MFFGATGNLRASNDSQRPQSVTATLSKTRVLLLVRTGEKADSRLGSFFTLWTADRDPSKMAADCIDFQGTYPTFEQAVGAGEILARELGLPFVIDKSS